MASNITQYTFPELLAECAVADGSGNIAIRVEDTGTGGTVPAAILSQIANSNNPADALRHFISEDGNGDMALKIAIDVSAST
jgi:hypothetical protein